MTYTTLLYCAVLHTHSAHNSCNSKQRQSEKNKYKKIIYNIHKISKSSGHVI